MRITNKKTIILLICCVLFTLSTGCTNWKAEYDKLFVVNQNLEGRLKQKDDEQKQLSDRIYQDQETIDELKRQIEEKSKTPAQASGFEGFDVDFNAAAGTITVTLPNSILPEKNIECRTQYYLFSPAAKICGQADRCCR